MEITKIYSDPWDGERYYSVLMDEDEFALFSDESEYLADTLTKEELKKMNAFALQRALDEDKKKSAHKRKFHKIGATVTGAVLGGLTGSLLGGKFTGPLLATGGVPVGALIGHSLGSHVGKKHHNEEELYKKLMNKYLEAKGLE